MFDRREAGFFIDGYAKVSYYVELYECVEVYDGREAGFLYMCMCMFSKFGHVRTKSKESEVLYNELNHT